MLHFTATSLPRIIVCGGSLKLDVPSPHTPNNRDDQIEGDAAHTVLVKGLDGTAKNPLDLINQKVNNNFIVTDDMVEHIAPIIETIRARGIQTNEEYPAIWTVTPEIQINGRCDVHSFDHSTGTLYIDDLKYGYRLVEPEMHWTLISHALATLWRHPDWNIQRVVFTIFQPRPFHPAGTARSWIINIDYLLQLRDYMVARFSALDDTLVTGSHCYKCAGLYNCPAARQAGLNAVDVSLMLYHENLTGHEVGMEMLLLERAADAIKARLDALQSLADSMLRDAGVVTGYTLNPSYGHRKWLPNITAEIVQMMTGKNVTKTEIMSPTEAKKAGVSEEIIASLAPRPFKGMKLSREDGNKKAQRLLGKQ